MCVLCIINTNSTTDDLISILLQKGGRINEYYLQAGNQNKHATLYLNGWFSGKNIRDALLKALA